MKKLRTNSINLATVALVGIAALIGGASLAVGPASAGDDDSTDGLQRPNARALVATCIGKATVGVRTRSTDFQSVPAGTTAELEGSQWSVKGPRHGTDVVLATVSSMASSGGAGELTSIALFKDGVGTAEGTKYFTYNGILDQASVQFCTKIGHGTHTLSVRVTDGGGGAATMYFPSITYQRFN